MGQTLREQIEAAAAAGVLHSEAVDLGAAVMHARSAGPSDAELHAMRERLRDRHLEALHEIADGQAEQNKLLVAILGELRALNGRTRDPK